MVDVVFFSLALVECIEEFIVQLKNIAAELSAGVVEEVSAMLQVLSCFHAEGACERRSFNVVSASPGVSEVSPVVAQTVKECFDCVTASLVGSCSPSPWWS